MDLMFENELTAIFRPSGLMIDWKNMVISIYTPSGLNIILPNQKLSLLGTTTEEKITNLNDYLFIKFHKDKEFLIASEVIPLRGTVETTIAQEIMEKSKHTILDLLLIGLGYKPEKPMQRLFIPRLLSWFKGYDGKPIHIAQFTQPETAKTNFGIRNETLLNWKYIPEPPTLARLILDARQGILGEVFLRNGIVFDEFDKWSVDTQDRRYTFDSILTGMEQGKWERGVSSMGGNVPDRPRYIPLVFFGNLSDFQKLQGMTMFCTRAWFTQVMTAHLTHDVSALADRLAVIDICFERVPVMDYLTYKVLPDSVIRGMIKILQDKVMPCDVSKLKGRLRRHANNIHAILNTFTLVTPKVSDEIVAGTYDWDAMIRTTPNIEEMFPKRDSVSTNHKETPQP